jgi:hypothetical protein
MLRKRLSAAGLLAAAVALGLVFSLTGGETAQPRKKAPIPDKAAQAKARKLIEEVYSEDYARAKKDPAVLAGLARTLLQEARDTTDDLGARYVLFQEASALAARAGDAPTALQALDEAAREFAISPAAAFRAKVAALGAASKATALADAYQTVVDASLALLEEALSLDDYEEAQALVSTAEAAARKLKVIALVRAIQKRGQEVQKLQDAYAPIKPSADRLREDPRDPKANLVMGRFQAFTKGNWEKGLPLLARGSDSTLKGLAKDELAAPEEARAQLALADGWWKAAGKASGDAKTQMLVRALAWYQQAASHLDGKPRAQAEARIKTINEALPPEYRTGEIVAELRRFDLGGPVFDVAFSPDGRTLVAGGADHAVRVLDARSGKEARRLDGHGGPVWTVVYSPDGRHVLSGGFDKAIRLWDLVSGREVRRFDGSDDYVRSVCFSRDGKWILSGGDDRKLRLWDAGSGKEVRQFPGHDHFVWSVDLSRDGRHALSGSLDRTVRLWDVESGNELRKLTGHADTVMAVAFAPDGRRALSGSTDRTLKLWDLDSGREIRTFTGHKGYVLGVAFSPDGRRALSSGADGTLRLWDVETGEEVRRLEAGNGEVWSVAFARDGRRAASAGNDGVVRLWGSAR